MLSIENLQWGLNGKLVIDGLNMHVGRGEIYGILGENGTGKTSLTHLIMGTNNYKPTGGDILFEGQNLAGLSISQRARMGISLAWQEPVRIEGLMVEDYLRISGKNFGIEQVKHCLEMVGLSPSIYLSRDIDSTLSGGERKRIEMASLVAMHPKLAILDEPDSGVDIPSLPLILNSIMEMSRQGSSVLLITHNEKVVEIAHRVSVLCGGKIFMTGTPAETSHWFKDNCQTCPHINEPVEL
ncbi:MAG: ATP-binding cassette domain-containing protein [Dehalococcoidales bacterium]|nr:ATP-binding cassette domain-containing protein [Dehalococcoidales bacterium]